MRPDLTQAEVSAIDSTPQVGVVDQAVEAGIGQGRIAQGVRFIAEGIVDHPHRFQAPDDHEMQALPGMTRKRPEGVLPGRLRETRAFGRETRLGVPGSSPQLQCS